MRRSTLLFVDDAGRVVLGRDYRGEVGSLRIAEFCSTHLRSGGGALARGDAPPVLLFDGSSFIVRRVRGGGGVWLVGATSANANAALCVAFLAAFERLLSAYFSGEPPTPSALRGKAALVFALLDEVSPLSPRDALLREGLPRVWRRDRRCSVQVLDHGIPQILEPAALSTYIISKGAGGPGASSAARRAAAAAPSASLDATGAVPWRARGVRYANNQLFLDVVERVDCTLSASGQLLTGDVNGIIKVRCELSGLPTCVIALNDPLRGGGYGGGDEDDGGGDGGLTPGAPEAYRPRGAALRRRGSSGVHPIFSFHQCVRLRAFDEDNAEIVFVPPDGEFQLLTYRAGLEGTKPPLKVVSSCVQHGRARVELVVLLRATAPPGSTVYDTRVRLPLPRGTAGVTARTGGGAKSRAKWLRADGVLQWKVPELPGGGGEASINVAIDVTPPTLERPGDGRWAPPPATLSFSVPGISATGLRVRYLRVQERAAYAVTKWVRYALVSGNVEARLA